MRPPEQWRGGWILAVWLCAGLLLLVVLQLVGLDGTRGEPSAPRSHLRPLVLLVASLAAVAAPLYVTDRWLRARSRRRSTDGDEEGRQGTDPGPERS